MNDVPNDYLNQILCGDCVDLMKRIPNDSIDLILTSPPYDDLRDYKGYHFDFQAISREILRIIKPTGVVVWVIGDRIVKGNRTLTSFKQALAFQDIGFKVHDVMIYRKRNTPFMRSNAYTSCYEFMLILTKGKPGTFNPIYEKSAGNQCHIMRGNKGKDGVYKVIKQGQLKENKVRSNIWEYAVGLYGTTSDKIAFKHPAVFPENLAKDHILSWTNENDIVLDPMCGSGTTCKMAKLTNRNFIGMDISEEYCRIAQERVSKKESVSDIGGRR